MEEWPANIEKRKKQEEKEKKEKRFRSRSTACFSDASSSMVTAVAAHWALSPALNRFGATEYCIGK